MQIVSVPKRTARGVVTTGARVALVLAALPAAGTTALLPQDEPERFVRHLSFSGNDAIEDRVLGGAIETSRSGYFVRSPLVRWLGLGKKAPFNERAFRRDVLRIQALYGASGYRHATVDTVVERGPSAVDIRFRITEGAPLRITSLTITGAEGLSLERAFRRQLPLAVGAPFNRLLLQTSTNVLRAIVRDAGYPFASVSARFTDQTSDTGAHITFTIVPGRRARVAAIDVVGSRRIDDRLVRRVLAVRAGQRFSDSALYNSQLAVYRMNTFSFVNVSLVDSLPDSPDDSLVTVRVQLVDGPLEQIRLGAGYGTLDCFRALGSWTRFNFSGGARTLRVNARASQIGTGAPFSGGFENSVCPGLSGEDPARLKMNYNVSASLFEPYLFSERTSATFTVFAERHTEFQAYLREAVGGEVALTRRIRRVPVTLSYGVSYGSTAADDVTFCAFLNVCDLDDTRAFRGRRIRAALSLAAVRNRTNSAFNPTRGHIVTAEVRWASPWIGSDSLVDFIKANAELASFHQLSSRTMFAWRLRAGSVFGSRFRGGARFVPLEDRFYLGGPNSVRGFVQNELGPVVRVLDTVITRETLREGVPVVTLDSVIRTSATGGDQLVLASAELRIALAGAARQVVGALFVDAGQVTDRDERELLDLHVTPGLGVRIASPIGPLRFDLAYNPHSPRDGPLFGQDDGVLRLLDDAYRPDRSFLDRLRLHFSIGHAF